MFMAGAILILTIVCLCLMFGIAGMSYADPTKSYADSGKNTEVILKRHINKVQRTNPEQYQAMVERAGGNITGCVSCHKGHKGMGMQIGK